MIAALLLPLALAEAPAASTRWTLSSMIFPDAAAVGDTPALLRAGLSTSAWGDGGGLTPGVRLYGELGLGLGGGFAWRTGLLLGSSLWVSPRLGTSLLVGIEGDALTGGRLPAAAQVPFELAVHAGPLSLYGRPSLVLGRNNPRQDGAAFGDELDLGVGIGLGRVGLRGELNQLLGTRAFTVGLTLRPKDDDGDDWDEDEDWEAPVEEPYEPDAGLFAEPEVDPGAGSGALCEAVRQAVTHAPTRFEGIRGAERPGDGIGTTWTTSVVPPGSVDTWVAPTSLMGTPAWNTQLYEGLDVVAANNAWLAAADAMSACSLPGGSWVYENQDLGTTRYQSWVPFGVPEYDGVYVLVEWLNYPDIDLETFTTRDAYMVFVRVISPE